LLLFRTNENSFAGKSFPIRKNNIFKLPVFFLNANNPFLTNRNIVLRSQSALIFGECRHAVGSTHWVIAPSFEQFVKSKPGSTVAVKRKRLVTHFPAVTVQTMKNAFGP